MVEKSTDAPPADMRAQRAVGKKRRRSNAELRRLQIMIAVGVLVVALAVGEWITRAGLVSKLVLPTPSSALRALYLGLFVDGRYWSAIYSTMSSALIGFGLAAVIALACGALLTALPFLEGVVYPYIVAFQSLPKIAVSPLIILWLGFGNMGKTTIVVLVAFFPILVNSIQGMRVRDRDQYELLISMGATKRQLFRLLRLPGGVPYFFAGFQVGIIFSLLGAIVAEFVGSRNGLGYMLLAERNVFNVPGVFAILIILMILGTALSTIMNALEKKAAFWSVDVSTRGDVTSSR